MAEHFIPITQDVNKVSLQEKIKRSNQVKHRKKQNGTRPPIAAEPLYKLGRYNKILGTAHKVSAYPLKHSLPRHSAGVVLGHGVSPVTAESAIVCLTWHSADS